MSETSLAAFASIKPIAGTIRADVLNFIAARGLTGATREEIHFGTGIKHQTINPRLRELEDDGLIVDSGRRRQQSSGRNAVAWILYPEDAPDDNTDD